MPTLPVAISVIPTSAIQRSERSLERAGETYLRLLAERVRRQRELALLGVTLLLAVAVLAAIVPTVIVGGPGWWVDVAVVAIIIITIAGVTLYLLPLVLSLVEERGTISRSVGYLTVRDGGFDPALIASPSRHGAAARRWIRARRVNATARDTYDRLADEWEGTAAELVVFATHIG